MSRADGVRERVRSVLSVLPAPVAGALRTGARRARTADRKRLLAGALDRAGRAGRTVPGAARVLGRRWSVVATSWSGITVTDPDGTAVARSTDPHLDRGPAMVLTGSLTVRVPDAPALLRLVWSGLLGGQLGSVRVRVDRAPEWLRAGARTVPPDPTTTRPSALSWRSAAGGVDVAVSFDRPCGTTAALDAVLRCVMRTRSWPQAGGPVPVIDRAAWLDGSATPGHGALLDVRPVARSLGPGPLRPFADPAPWPGSSPAGCPVGAVAFPHRRRLMGEPAHHRLRGDGPGRWLLLGTDGVLARLDGSQSPEAVLCDASATRYATVTLPPDLDTGGPAGRWLRLVVATLATSGLVAIATDRTGEALLSDLGIPAPGSPSAVTGVEGYAWSVAVSRAAGVLTDATLRRTALAAAIGGPPPDGALLALPTVSVLLPTMRPDTVGAVLTDLAAQNYPEFEVLLGAHGWVPDPALLAGWAARLGRPLRLVDVAVGATFGQVLGALTRAADGDVLTKVDDDDVYGPDHLTDLVLAWHQTGADLVAKAPRFVHLQDAPADPAASPDPRDGGGRTIDRSWAASEVFGRTPAGGTLLTARSTLLDAGGWSESVRHVDIDIAARIRQAGGVTYRTHGLGYVYVRHARGHTWEASESVFLEQAGDVVGGLPAAIATGRPTAAGSGSAAVSR